VGCKKFKVSERVFIKSRMQADRILKLNILNNALEIVITSRRLKRCQRLEGTW